MKKTTFQIDATSFDWLHRHLFPGDGDEHGALILAGIVETPWETRFLARQIIVARDGIDFVPGKFGYRAFPADFVARWSNQCAREKLCYFNVHCHGGRDSVGFSGVDLQSHQRGYPALVDITNGGPVGALVFAKNAVAGEIWTREGIRKLNSMTVLGLNRRRLFPEPQIITKSGDEMYNRQSLMFGELGQHQLGNARVGIIGLGGVGSLVNEYVARLGVGEIVGVDFDRMERSNCSRVVGSRVGDCFDWLRNSRYKSLRKIGERRAAYKVRVAERVARLANPQIRFRGIIGDVTEFSVARQLRDVDFLFLCADSMQSRLVFNALVHQYLIPGVQIGSKVPVDEESGDLGNVFSTARLVLPFRGGGCLLCNELIPAAKLQEEALTPQERQQQRYVDDVEVAAPSVITLNAVGAAQASNDFLFHMLGLFDPSQARSGYLLHYARERIWRAAECRAETNCLHCGPTPASVFARGDRASLPCKN